MKRRPTLSLKRDSDLVAPERLQKLLSKAGLGSRRMIEERVLRGEIEVDGRPAAIGDSLGDGQTIKVDDREFVVRAVTHEGPRVLAYNKPEGEVTTTSDPEGRPTVFDRLPRLKGMRWIVVGRLDLNTAGLLLFTTDGELANRLMHPSHEVEREYLVRVHGEIEDSALQQLLKGVQLEDGPAHFDEIEALGGEGSNKWYKVIISEGRQREVRRLWEAVGAEVSRLKRVRYGVIELGKELKRGWYRELEAEEIQRLMEAADLPMTTRNELRIMPIEVARKFERNLRYGERPGSADRGHGDRPPRRAPGQRAGEEFRDRAAAPGRGGTDRPAKRAAPARSRDRAAGSGPRPSYPAPPPSRAKPEPVEVVEPIRTRPWRTSDTAPRPGAKPASTAARPTRPAGTEAPYRAGERSGPRPAGRADADRATARPAGRGPVNDRSDSRRETGARPAAARSSAPRSADRAPGKPWSGERPVRDGSAPSSARGAARPSGPRSSERAPARPYGDRPARDSGAPDKARSAKRGEGAAARPYGDRPARPAGAPGAPRGGARSTGPRAGAERGPAPARSGERPARSTAPRSSSGPRSSAPRSGAGPKPASRGPGGPRKRG